MSEEEKFSLMNIKVGNAFSAGAAGEHSTPGQDKGKKGASYRVSRNVLTYT